MYSYTFSIPKFNYLNHLLETGKLKYFLIFDWVESNKYYLLNSSIGKIEPEISNQLNFNLKNLNLIKNNIGIFPYRKHYFAFDGKKFHVINDFNIENYFYHLCLNSSMEYDLFPNSRRNNNFYSIYKINSYSMRL